MGHRSFEFLVLSFEFHFSGSRGTWFDFRNFQVQVFNAKTQRREGAKGFLVPSQSPVILSELCELKDPHK